jgi:hypothetical protein
MKLFDHPVQYQSISRVECSGNRRTLNQAFSAIETLSEQTNSVGLP